MRLTALLAVASLAGCVTREIRASPAELEAAKQLLAAGHPAQVATQEDGLVTVAPERRVVIVDTANKRFDLSIAEIVKDCADHPPENNRLCELHGVQHVVLGQARKVHEGVYLAPIGAVIVGAIVGAVVGVSYCAIECDNIYARRSSQVVVGALAVGMLYAVFTGHPRRR